MVREPMYVKMARLRAETEPEVTLIEETDGRNFRLYSEKHHGACVTAGSEEAALARIDGEINSLWSWAKGKPYTYKYKHRIIESFTADYPLDGTESHIIFSIERGPFHAIAYRVMKDMAVRSALCLGQMIESLPDADAPLYGLPDGLTTAADVRRAAFFGTGELFNKLGIGYENKGDLYANRMFAVSSAETEGFMRNAEHICDGEVWTLRKVLRRIIWRDRILAKALYRAAETEWGKGVCADPFAFFKIRRAREGRRSE